MNVTPRYDQKTFNAEGRKGKLQTIVSSFDDEDTESLKIHQDATLSRIDLEEGETFKYQLKSENHGVYLMIISGKVDINGEILESRDAIGISETDDFNIVSKADSELLFIEVPMINL